MGEETVKQRYDYNISGAADTGIWPFRLSQNTLHNTQLCPRDCPVGTGTTGQSKRELNWEVGV